MAKHKKRSVGGHQEPPAELMDEGASMQEPMETIQESPSQKQARAAREAKIQQEAEASELERINRHVNEYRGDGLLFPYQVAPRRKVRTKLVAGGFLVSGAEVKPEYVGGQDTLDSLVRGGSVLKRA